MKQNYNSIRLRYTICIVFSFYLLSNVLIAQNPQTNSRVNMFNYEHMDTDSDNCLAVLEDSVYVVFQGEPSDTIISMFFTKSTNGGQIFEMEKSIFPFSTDTLFAKPSIAVDNNGIIYVTYTFVNNTETEYNIGFTKSTDGGASFESHKSITTTNSFIYSSIGIYGSNVYIFYSDLSNYPGIDHYFVRSTDGGNTFGTPTKINSVSGVNETYFSNPNTIEIDSDGNIYLAWLDSRRTDGNGDIYFCKSTDAGLSFTNNVMVNDISSIGADSIQYHPKIALLDNNVIMIGFTDLRNGQGNFRTYAAKSIDGGQTFQTEVLLGNHNNYSKFYDIVALPGNKLSAVMCTNNSGDGPWLFESDDNGTNFFTPVAFTDTLNTDNSDVHLTLNQDGDAFAIWKDNRTQTHHNLYFSKIENSLTDIKINKYEFNPIVYPNPSNDKFFVELGKTYNKVDITISHLNGQTVHTQSFYNTQIIENQLSLPQGIYILNINADNQVFSNLKIIKID